MRFFGMDRGGFRVLLLPYKSPFKARTALPKAVHPSSGDGDSPGSCPEFELLAAAAAATNCSQSISRSLLEVAMDDMVVVVVVTVELVVEVEPVELFKLSA